MYVVGELDGTWNLTEELMTMDATRRAPGRHLLWRPLFHSQNTLLGTCLMTLLCRPTRFINSGLRSMAACAGARRDPGDWQWPPAVLHPVSGRHGVPQQLPPLILPRNSILSPPSSILSSPPLATTSPRQPDAVLPAVDMHQEGVRLLIVSDIAQVRRRRMNGVTGPGAGIWSPLGVCLALHPHTAVDELRVLATRTAPHSITLDGGRLGNAWVCLALSSIWGPSTTHKRNPLEPSTAWSSSLPPQRRAAQLSELRERRANTGAASTHLEDVQRPC